MYERRSKQKGRLIGLPFCLFLARSSLLAGGDEGVVVRLDGLVEVRVCVHVAGEHGFELRRGEVDALVEHRVEVPAVLGCVSRDRRLVIDDRGFGEEEAGHGAYAVLHVVQAELLHVVPETGFEERRFPFELRIGVLFHEDLEGFKACGQGERVA